MKLLITDRSKVKTTLCIEILPKAYTGECWNVDSAYIYIDDFEICKDIFFTRIPDFIIESFNLGLSGEVAHLIANDLSFLAKTLKANQSVEPHNLPELLAGRFKNIEWCRDYIFDTQSDLVANNLIELLSDLADFMKNNILLDGEWCVLGI